MLLKAKARGGFLGRLALIVLFCLGGCLWFAYDGAIGYPKQRVRALEYERLEKAEQLDQWEAVAEQHGWPLDPPGKPKDEIQMRFQLVMAAVVAVPGLLYLFFFFRFLRRGIEANDTGLRTSWGQQLEFGQIVSLDKKQWKRKGIARVYYQQDDRKRRLVLDDWKYETEPTRAILCEVESRIDAGRIVGGPPEPPPEERQPEATSADSE